MTSDEFVDAVMGIVVANNIRPDQYAAALAGLVIRTCAMANEDPVEYIKWAMGDYAPSWPKDIHDALLAEGIKIRTPTDWAQALHAPGNSGVEDLARAIQNNVAVAISQFLMLRARVYGQPVPRESTAIVAELKSCAGAIVELVGR